MKVSRNLIINGNWGEYIPKRNKTKNVISNISIANIILYHYVI